VWEGRLIYHVARETIGNATANVLGSIRNTYWSALDSQGWDRVVDQPEDLDQVPAAVAAFFPGGLMG
jgi:hypothetical protein